MTASYFPDIIMLKKKYRLKNEKAFSATYRIKNCKSNEFLTLYVGKNKIDDTIPTKVAFIVSKKIHKRAVKRNKIKRRLREIYIAALNNHLADNLQKALSLIFIARGKALDASFSELQNAVTDIIKKF